MLDIKFIRNNKELIEEAIKNKNINLDLEELLSLDEKRRDLIKKIDELNFEQKKITKEKIEEGKKIKQELKIIESELKEIEEKYNNLMLLVPNVYSSDTPIGQDERDNKEVFKWGEIPKFDFEIKDHIQLGKDLNLIDLEKGVKTSGFRGYYLKNEAVLLEIALIWHSLLKMRNHGFTLMIPPTILKEFALVGSGHFPMGKEDIYQIANPGKLSDGKEISEPLFLAGTSEPALLAYFADEVLDKKDLPIKVCGVSNCYRSEVGSYGKDTKGLYRVHEFRKVEQVVLCENDIEKSCYWLEEMRKISEEILKDLELPYRVIQICTGDMGCGKYKMYDIETYMPSRNSYGETHSDSNLTDWQARRLNIKYKDENGEKKYVHTLNNTVIASPRILIAILENYQQKDGSIKVPKVLQKYLDFEVIK
ncbi:MAG TPA: serine--tRNA ligase [Candidatus Pacearchaeota archaeon]|nr:serine--tRNA ligase [Candidatus Paceibacterota bacterium]HPO68605.1 serine--tRNA ligase [Candidatus Pacearchaeota archaeon]